MVGLLRRPTLRRPPRKERTMRSPIHRRRMLIMVVVLLVPTLASAQKPGKKGAAFTFPPKLPDGKEVVTDKSDDFLKAPATLKKDVAVAKTAPTVDFLFFPGQTYEGKLWSNWGDSLAVDGKYYASLG